MTDSREHELDQALAAYLARREDDTDLLPGAFAAALPAALVEPFLAEVEALAEIDRLALAPPRDLPRRLGDYRIIAELGCGATGRVYEAEQVSLQRRVALKVLHPHVAAAPRLLARFRREAQIAAALQHSHIVPIHGVCTERGTAFLVMGLVEGRSLQRLLAARRDSRDIDRARADALFGDSAALANAFAAVADALHFAHSRGTVHRDIKPANLIGGADGTIVVLDFGIASSSRGGQHTLTATGDFLGTPIYMSPEQATGTTAVGPASDVYSLGAVLYECATGQTCVRNGPLPVVLERVRSDETALLSLRSVPAGLSAIIAKCLRKDPAQRYGTAAELAADLRRFASGERVAARIPSRFAHTASRVARRARAPLLAGVVGVGLGLMATMSVDRPPPLPAINSGLAQHLHEVRVELQALDAVGRAMQLRPELLQDLLLGANGADPAR